MADVTFITGNQDKADYLAKCLGYPLAHIKLDLDEIQSLDLAAVVTHKVKQAYESIHKPVLVDDVSLEFSVFGRLPGTFIKWYIDELGLEKLCRMLDGKDRSAVARGMFGYFDGQNVHLFAGKLRGEIAQSPRGSNGFGWDAIFIPEGQKLTRAEMDDAGDMTTYRSIKPIAEFQSFLEKL